MLICACVKQFTNFIDERGVIMSRQRGSDFVDEHRNDDVEIRHGDVYVNNEKVGYVTGDGDYRLKDGTLVDNH